ncbi:MAG: hypothetical protein AB2792_23045 [Candidatus Thiodiazotropha sp.]
MIEAFLDTRDRNLMKHGVSMLRDYWGTYDMQLGYEDYSIRTLIDDALYGLGIAIDKEQFKSADGYEAFKLVLIEYLNSQQIVKR